MYRMANIFKFVKRDLTKRSQRVGSGEWGFGPKSKLEPHDKITDNNPLSPFVIFVSFVFFV
jgi:hypothetical protein